MELIQRAAIFQQSEAVSTSFLDFDKPKGGRNTSTGSADRNRDRPARQTDSPKRSSSPEDPWKNWKSLFAKEPRSRSEERALALSWAEYDRERFHGASQQGTKYHNSRPKSQDSGIKSRTNSTYLEKRDGREWMGEGDKAEREAEERVARATTGMAAQKRAKQKLIDLQRVRFRSPNGPRS